MGSLIFFAIIAVFVLLRLYKILGDTKYHTELSDKEKKAFSMFKEGIDKEIEAKAEEVAVIETATQAESELPKEIQDFFISLRKMDRSFTAEKFLDGVSRAFPMILTAISDRDKEVLSQLSTKEMCEKFCNYIDRLQMSGQYKSIVVVGVKEIKVLDAQIIEQKASISLMIVSEQITCIKDAVSNTVISGSESLIKQCEDKWTFEKFVNDNSGMWKLASDE